MDATVATGRNTEQRQYGLPYVPALDGLRGVAVSLVFLTHIVSRYRGGTFGVDIFFVLSGYLITEVIYKSIDDKYFVGVFYFRRFVRLFPALAAACLFVASISGYLGQSENIIKDALSSILYAQSWTSALNDGFSFYLGNTWSLSVEEQFYLIWPFAMILAIRLRKQSVAPISIAILAASIAWALHIAYMGTTYNRMYYSPDARAQAILIGAFASVAAHGAPTKLNAFLRRAIGTLSIAPAAILVWFCATKDWSIPGSLAISALTALVIYRIRSTEASIESRALSFPPLVQLGKISYGFYLWHGPILIMLEYHFKLDAVSELLIGLPLSLLLAVASYVLLERPALNLRLSVPKRIQFKIGIATLVVSTISIFGGLLYFQWQDVIDVVNPQPIRVLAYGPPEYRIGDKGAIQPDGSLVMWIKVNKRPDPWLAAEVSGIRSTASIVDEGIDVVIPPSVITKPGNYTVTVVTSLRIPEFPPLNLRVVP